ncbi:alpha/beta fold hydrolase [Streptomyces sp. MP131-18]|uniref:alpha/beta fold hydrolase n=1 Tax=Streptomyces sp. MP131-18 TaxID=1857892 RepID=UPI00209B3F00|nr:alpha/beta fold hydrolase [Streptomyces sp. MP131-18]
MRHCRPKTEPGSGRPGPARALPWSAATAAPACATSWATWPGCWRTWPPCTAGTSGDAGGRKRCGPYSVARSVADLDAVRRHFGLHRMALLGHSYGAGLALRYALEHPEHVSKPVHVSGNGIDSRDTWRTAYRQNLRASLGTHLARWETLDSSSPRTTATGSGRWNRQRPRPRPGSA